VLGSTLVTSETDLGEQCIAGVFDNTTFCGSFDEELGDTNAQMPIACFKLLPCVMVLGENERAKRREAAQARAEAGLPPEPDDPNDPMKQR
jgi:hypothetical protein